MNIDYNIWWHVFKHQYLINDKIEVESSGVYFNTHNKYYEAHFKDSNVKLSVVIARISERMMNNMSKNDASEMALDLCSHLQKFQKASNEKQDIEQFKDLGLTAF